MAPEPYSPAGLYSTLSSHTPLCPPLAQHSSKAQPPHRQHPSPCKQPEEFRRNNRGVPPLPLVTCLRSHLLLCWTVFDCRDRYTTF